MSNTNTPRTRLEWFSMFPEPYRQQAIENYDGFFDGRKGKSLFDDAADALFDGFCWGESPQDHNYWKDFHTQLKQGKVILTAAAEEMERDTFEENYLNQLIDNANKEFALDRKLAKEVAVKFAKWQAAQATPDYEAIVKELVEMVSVKVSGDGDYYTGKQHAYNGILDFIKSKTESK